MSRANDRFDRFCKDILRVVFVLFVARAIMLLLHLPIVFIPYLDDSILRLGNELKELARGLSNASWLPRL